MAPMAHAQGTFEVDLRPVDAPSPAIGQMTIDKQFAGALQGRSRGCMLAYRTDTEGSAAYVALETVEGTLDGVAGTFVLQHAGTMDRGEQALVVSVVPDSGTGGLRGLRGRMNILIEDGAHKYTFEYTLPG